MSWATAAILKTDNGYNSVILFDSDRGLYKAGDVLFNRQLHPFPKGTFLMVTINFSVAGRRMVKGIKEYKTPTTEMVDAAARVMMGKIVATPAPTPKAAVEEKEAVTPRKRTAKPKSPIEGYYVSPEARLVFNTALGMSNGRPERAVKLMMVGQSGYGKTTLPKLFAELAGKEFMRMNCATVRDPEEWFGFREAREGSTVFIKSEFAKAIERGNLVVILDEFNRLEPWLHNTLFPLLDDDGCTVVHDEEFRIGEGVIVVGTINTGYKFTGTFELDEALMNRFDFVLEVGAMPHHDEVKVLTTRTCLDRENATHVVKMANTLRQSDVVCSTRTTLLVASMFCSGMTLREAFETAVVRRIPEDTAGSNLRKKVVDMINTALGVLEKRTLPNDIFSGTEEKIEEKVQPAGLRIVMRRAENKEWLPIHAANWMRKMPVAEGDGQLPFSTVQNLVRSIGDGKEVVVYLKEGLSDSDYSVIITHLSMSGITGVVTRK